MTCCDDVMNIKQFSRARETKIARERIFNILTTMLIINTEKKDVHAPGTGV
jgi:hypothetical protein